jgi:hypothetical protein
MEVDLGDFYDVLVTLLGKTRSIDQAQFSRRLWWGKYLSALFLAMCFPMACVLLSVRSAAAETLCVSHSGNFVSCSNLAPKDTAIPASGSHVVQPLRAPVHKPSPVDHPARATRSSHYVQPLRAPVRKATPVADPVRAPSVSPPPRRAQQIYSSGPTLDPALVASSGGALAAAGVVAGTGYVVGRRRRASQGPPRARHSMSENIAP